jgi:hypothetical protein
LANISAVATPAAHCALAHPDDAWREAAGAALQEAQRRADFLLGDGALCAALADSVPALVVQQRDSGKA